jgi:hypothetical protein
MDASHLLPAELQIPALLVLGLFLAWVLRLIRAHQLSVRDSLAWLLTTLLALIATAFPSLLVAVARLLGVQVPSNAVFGLGLLYLAVNVLAVTLTASAATARTRRLAQECALLRAELDELRAGLGPAGPAVDAPRERPGGPGGPRAPGLTGPARSE